MASVYKIYADDVLIYHTKSPAKEVKLINPRLTLEVNSAGSFTCTIPPTNNGFSTVNRLTSTITVYRDYSDVTSGQEAEIWSGRIINEQQDFWGNRQITCEGELAYLNDTTQPPSEYHNMTVRSFLETLISKHNAKCTTGQTFRVGIVTVTDPNDSIYHYTNFESTLECIADKLIDRLGGYIRIRKENGVRYIDYLKQSTNLNTQTIEFGKNLLDFSKSWDLTDFATVVVPQGARLDESPIEALDAYLDVKSVNSGSIYVYDQNTVNNYGWIETVVRWDDVTVASNLLAKARAYLSEIQFEKMVLELSAVDLSYMTEGVETIELFDEIRCISTPHGMNKVFPVTKIDIPLDAPENTIFTLGDREEKMSLSGSIKKGNSAIQNQIDSIPSTTSVLDEARENADQIMRQLSNGYITTVISGTGDNAHSEALYISNTQNYLQATKYWKWNVNGLAYYNLTEQPQPKLAITMDGAISADFITAGTMSADRVRTGILTDTQGNMSWNLNTGYMTATNLKIETDYFLLDYDGSIRSGSDDDYVYLDAGNMKTKDAYDQEIDIGSGKIAFYDDGYYTGGIYANTYNGGSLELNATDYLYLYADHIIINGTEAGDTSDNTCHVRASNGQVMRIGFDHGIYTGYDLFYDEGYEGWLSVISGIDDIWIDSDNVVHWSINGFNMYVVGKIIDQVDFWN